MFKLYRSEVFQSPEADCRQGVYPVSVGHMIANPDYVCRTRIMDDYFMIFPTAGKGVFRCAGREYSIGTGDLYFLLPGVPHFYATDPQDLMEQWWVGFNGASAAALFKKLGISPLRPIVAGGGTEEILTLLRRMMSVNANQLNGQLCVTGFLCQLLGLLMEQLNPNATVASGGCLRSRAVLIAHEFIHIHYAQDISIEDVAAHAGLSRAHLSVVFKKEMGMSPSQYLAFIRLSHAKTLLDDPSMSIAEVARAAGFDDALYFSKFFSKQVGMSPSAFRKG